MSNFNKCFSGYRITVFCISFLSQDDINCLQNSICSEEHLKRNITKIEFEKISKWEVYTKLFVLTNNLWEGPRAYMEAPMGSKPVGE